MERALVALATVALGAITALALWEGGFVAIFTGQLRSYAGMQVLLDLVIALGLVLVWMVRDARTLGRNPWPFVVLTLAAGSFGPLLYLLTRKQATTA